MNSNSNFLVSECQFFFGGGGSCIETSNFTITIYRNPDENITFINNNATPNPAHIVNTRLQDVDVSYIKWPAISPDLITTERFGN